MNQPPWLCKIHFPCRDPQTLSASSKSFTGGHHFILDYLVEEVLQRQPEHVRTSTWQTSILERLGGVALRCCHGQQDGRGILETMERGNLFIVCSITSASGTAYHTTSSRKFSRRICRRRNPIACPCLDLRASEWDQQNGLRSDAIVMRRLPRT